MEKINPKLVKFDLKFQNFRGSAFIYLFIFILFIH